MTVDEHARRRRFPIESVMRSMAPVFVIMALASAGPVARGGDVLQGPIALARAHAAGASISTESGQGVLAPAFWPETVAFFREQAQQHSIVGSSLLAMKDGVVFGHEVYGLQDRDAKRAADRRTIFHWASITKTFTAIAIMQLRDRGLLALDDPIVKYVPELRHVHNPFGDMSAITIRHLLSHSSGFRDPTWGSWGGDKPWHPFEPPSWKQLDAMMPYTEILFEPGSRYGYSNPGFIYLGRTIEALTNDDYEMYVTKNILSPLGMHETFFDRAPYHLLPQRSHSYYVTDAGLKEARFDFDTGITVSNGGLNAPLTDMAKYLAFLAGAPTGSKQQAAYGIVLKRDSLEEMFRPQVAGPEPNVSMGLGYFLERRGGLDLVGHSGEQNGFISHFFVHPTSRAAFIVAYNTNASSQAHPERPSTRRLDDTIRDHFVRHVFTALAAKSDTQ